MTIPETMRAVTIDEPGAPEVLVPVYGAGLRFGELPGEDGGPTRPFVLPWRK